MWSVDCPVTLDRGGGRMKVRLPDWGKLSHPLVMSVKEQVLEAIQRLPDDINFQDVADEIALLAAVHEAERDIQEGRMISNDEMKSRIAQWSAG